MILHIIVDITWHLILRNMSPFLKNIPYNKFPIKNIHHQ